MQEAPGAGLAGEAPRADAEDACQEVLLERPLRPNTGKYPAALLRLADGKLLMLDDEGGLALVDPDPKEYKELARSKVCGNTWAHPALAGGRLYLRDTKEWSCLTLSETK